MKYLSPILVLILLSSVSAGQPKFKHLDISQGLSQNTINTMCQDSQGFLWIGTQDGLNRYDGYHFKIYRPEGNNPFSINAIDIWSIHQSDADSGNVLWIGTHAGGLNIYDIRADKFYHFLPDPDNPLSVSDKNILTVHSTTIDTTRIVMVGGQFHGMDILILKNNWIQEMRMGTLPWKEIYHFEHNPDDPESLSHNAINIFYEDTILQNKCVKTIWIGTYGGGLNRLDILQHDAGISYKINNSMVNSKQIHSGKDDNIKDIIIEKQSANRKIMWLGTHDGLKKLTLSLREDKHDAKVIKFEIFRHADNDPS